MTAMTFCAGTQGNERQITHVVSPQQYWGEDRPEKVVWWGVGVRVANQAAQDAWLEAMNTWLTMFFKPTRTDEELLLMERANERMQSLQIQAS